MRSLLRYAVVLVAVYLVAWTASYAVVTGFDFRYFFQYLRLAWTFSGGELPSFTWFFSIIAFLPLAMVAVYLLRKYERRAKDVA
jgi:membrane protein implicated in regulation of membrane protease activity